VRGAQLLGAGDAILHSLGARLWPADAREYERTSEWLEKALGSAAYDAGCRSGEQLSQDQAVALARVGSEARGVSRG
jgi:hypothetical protein